MSNEVTTYSFSFPSFIRDEFDKKFAKLNKKLANMKDGNEVQIVSEAYEVRDILKPEPRKEVQRTRLLPKAKRYVPTPEDYLKVNFTKVEVSLPVQQKLAGYELLGHINIEGDVKTIHALDDEVNLSEVDVKLCHHCNSRRKRKALTVFKEVSSGNQVAIGSTCVHDYLGLDIYPILKTFFNFYKEDDIYGSPGMRKAWGFPTEHIANACRVSHSINSTYVKAGDPRYGEYNENNTKSVVDYVHNVLYSPCTSTAELSKEYHEKLKSLPKVGSLLTEFYGDMDEKKSNFNSNIVETLFYTRPDGSRELRDFIVGKARGIFVWAVFNALNKSAEKKVQKSQPSTQNSQHIGKVGDRVEVQGKVTFTKVCDGYYGTSKMVKITDNDGNAFVTFGTGSGLWNLETGDEVTAKGTVSKHDEFKGVKQTSLKRLTVV
jgi:hypothetical protein